MTRFLPFQWYIHLVLLTVIVQNARGFSLNSRRSRSAIVNENVQFQPTPNLGKLRTKLFQFTSYSIFNFIDFWF